MHGLSPRQVQAGGHPLSWLSREGKRVVSNYFLIEITTWAIFGEKPIYILVQVFSTIIPQLR